MLTFSTLNSCRTLRRTLQSKNVSYSRIYALSYGEILIFFLEEKVWRFENVYVTYHANPQLLMDILANVC